MDTFELKREQLKLSRKIVLKDNFAKIKTVGGTACFPIENKLLAVVIVCEYPSMKVIEKQSYILPNPINYIPGFLAYREMPAIIEAYNKLEQEPDLLIVNGQGIAHTRKIGLASHLGLALNKATIGVTKTPLLGKIENGKLIYHNEIVGFEIKTREHANPVYVSPGHHISLGSTLRLITEMIIPPHKMPEPLHLARKYAKKEMKNE